MNNTATSNAPALEKRIDPASLMAWMVQYSPRTAGELRRDWNAGNDFEYPNVGRHADQIRANDIVLFWVFGPGDQAGVIGFGLASGEVEKLWHSKDYDKPDGPRVLRQSAEVCLCWVFDNPVMTRTELQQYNEFAKFDLFRMPNRSNAFEVTGAQWAIIMRRLQEVLGR